VRTLPVVTVADVFAAAYVLALVVYALLPQSWLGGGATKHGVLLALRHDLLPVGGYALGRLLGLVWQDPRRVGLVIALTATGVAVLGLLDVFLVPLQSWRDSGVPGWYREQLSLDYRCLSYLPENWIYNTGEESNPIRRLVSTFLSPLASAYVLTVALVFVVSKFFRWWALVLSVVLFVALLYTHTRAAVLALAAGLLLLALAQRRLLPVLAAAVVVLVSIGFFAAYSSLGPSTSYTASELRCLRANARQHPGVSAEPFSTSDASLSSHWRNLRDGVQTVLRHPQGYGLGNAGVVAKRTRVSIKAGESTYPELGVETGLAGALAFVLWNLALFWALWKRRTWLAGALAAVLLLGLQTDIIGVHWIAVVVWGAAGMAVTVPASGRESAAAEERV
jgi:hypothetical protein